MTAKIDRKGFLGRRWSCECGAVHEVPTKRAIIGVGASARAADLLGELGIQGPLFLLSDERTHVVLGGELTKALEAAGFDVAPHVLPGRPHADISLAESVAAAVPKGARAVVSCGSGTITDLAKWAAFKRGIPHVSVATAPSMNGYASGIVALIEGGLKTTRPVRPPLAVVADTSILAAAPLEMIRAGLGDVISKPVANADWRLSSVLFGESFCPLPFEMIRDLEKLYMRDAGLLARRDHAAVGALSEALVFSGVSMVIAGSSSPASGGEHLVSHFLDMRAMGEGREGDLHGAQVGVASIATAALYERLIRLKAGDLDRAKLETIWERAAAATEGLHRFLGGAAPAAEAEFRKKLPDREAARSLGRAILDRWDEIVAAVAPFLMPSSEMSAALASAGAKTKFEELGISQAEAREAMMLALFIRNRFTVLDLAFAVGELEGWSDKAART